MRNVFVWLVVCMFGLMPTISRADLSRLPKLESSVTGNYPEASLGNGEKLGLEFSAVYGPLGWKNEKFRTVVGSDRKLTIPDLSNVTKNEQKDLLPINVEFAVPSPGGAGVSYLRSFNFQTVEEYQNFFSGPLYVSFSYSSSAYPVPMTFDLLTKDRSSFADWYAVNVTTPAKHNCLFVGIQFLAPQASHGYGAIDLGDEIGPSGTRTSNATFLVFRADKPLTYRLTVFTSTNPYVCNSRSGSPTESMSKILSSEIRMSSAAGFPNHLTAIVP